MWRANSSRTLKKIQGGDSEPLRKLEKSREEYEKEYGRFLNKDGTIKEEKVHEYFDYLDNKSWHDKGERTMDAFQNLEYIKEYESISEYYEYGYTWAVDVWTTVKFLDGMFKEVQSNLKLDMCTHVVGPHYHSALLDVCVQESIVGMMSGILTKEDVIKHLSEEVERVNKLN